MHKYKNGKKSKNQTTTSNMLSTFAAVVYPKMYITIFAPHCLMEIQIIYGIFIMSNYCHAFAIDSGLLFNSYNIGN